MTQRKKHTPLVPLAANITDSVEKVPVPIILFTMRKTQAVTPSFLDSPIGIPAHPAELMGSHFRCHIKKS